MGIHKVISVLVAIGAIAGISQPAFAQARADVWAVGTSSTSTSQTLTEHWDGNAWSVVPSPSAPQSIRDSFIAVTALSSGDVWAAGEYDTEADFNQSIPHGLTEHWDGQQWSVGPPSKHYIAAISSAPTPENNVWLVGGHTQFSCRLPQGCGGTAFAYRWNGRAWKETAVQEPIGFAPAAEFNGVQALANGAVWAVGAVFRAYGRSDLIERWSSGAWSVISSGIFPHAILMGISGESDSDMWVIGETDTFSSIAGHWNGTSWASYRLGNDQILAIEENSPDDVWAVGTTGKTLIEHWDGIR